MHGSSNVLVSGPSLWAVFSFLHGLHLGFLLHDILCMMDSGIIECHAVFSLICRSYVKHSSDLHEICPSYSNYLATACMWLVILLLDLVMSFKMPRERVKCKLLCEWLQPCARQ